MTFISFIRRRLLGKWSQMFKRIAVLLLILAALHMLVGRKEEEKLDNLVIPGEAIDPLMNDIRHHVGNKMTHEFSKDGPPLPPAEGKEVKKDAAWSLSKANITDKEKVRFKPHAINNETVTLTLMSSADKVFMSLNKKEIYRNLHDRGLHLVVLNEHTGKVMASRVFDTFNAGPEEEMVEFLDDLQDGRIIVFAVLDEASKGLSWRGRNKLKEFGARFADKLNYRDMWALVTRKGGLKLAETYSNVATADTGYEWGGPVFLRTDFDLIEKPNECDWSVSERNDARRLFCRRYEGYGSMCDCRVRNWGDVFFHGDSKVHKEVSKSKLHQKMAVVILASSRPHYLYRTLKSVWEALGVNRERVVVYSDGKHREVTAIAKLFGVLLVPTSFKDNDTSTRIRHLVQIVFRDFMGSKFPEDTIPTGKFPEDTLPPFNADPVLILEDDLEVSIDFFKYLSAVYPIVDKDSTVLGISAFNYFGYRDVASSLSTFHRTNQMNQLAILLPARTVNDKMAPNWPKVASTEEWYASLKPFLNSTNGIIYPEVPRAHHFAYSGLTISGGVQLNLFKSHILALTSNYEVKEKDVDKLEVGEYEKWLSRKLNVSSPLTFDFCKYDLIYGEDPLVMFVAFDGTENFDAWRDTMNCLHTWSVYPEGGWKGVWQFHYHGHLLSVVGVPYSPYSYLKPSDYTLVTASPTKSPTTSPTTSTASPNSSTSKSSSP